MKWRDGRGWTPGALLVIALAAIAALAVVYLATPGAW